VWQDLGVTIEVSICWKTQQTLYQVELECSKLCCYCCCYLFIYLLNSKRQRGRPE
jgi:hypothetical protein